MLEKRLSSDVITIYKLQQSHIIPVNLMLRTGIPFAGATASSSIATTTNGRRQNEFLERSS